MSNSISVRVPGRAVGDTVADTGSLADRTAPRLVVLIHGYQNDERKARKSYGRFQARFGDAVPGGLGKAGAVWEFHWPGDHPLGAVSMTTYPVRVPVAILAGKALADDWLARLRRKQDVYIVAHSLGCRVALEAVRTIRRQGASWPGARVRSVFMLAPAVPVPQCEAAGPLGAPLARSSEHVFFSRSDWVLFGGFRPGQYLVGEHGAAVGRRGEPAPRWTSRNDTGLGHSGYWKSPDVVRTIAELLGLVPWRSIEERRLPRYEPWAEGRRLGERSLPARRGL